jgi:hypothetical protein
MTASDKIPHFEGIALADAKRGSSQDVCIAPDQATEMLETMKYPYQRKISKDRVRMLAREMVHGRFTGGTQIRVASFEDRKYLLDGQHRLSAVVHSGKAQWFSLMSEDAPSLEYIAWQYGTIDTGKGRTFIELTATLDLPDRLDMPAKHIRYLAAGVDVLLGGMSRDGRWMNKDKAERVRIVELYAPYMRQYAASIAGVSTEMYQRLMRSYAVAVGVVSFRYGHTIKTESFWRGAATDDMLGQHDPRKILHNHFKSTAMQVNRSNYGVSRVVSTAYGARAAAACYDYFMRGKSLTKIQVSDESAPFKMIGVPSDPREWLQ